MICILKVIHYFWLMFSKTSEKKCLKIHHLDPVKFLSAPGLAWQPALRKTGVKVGLLTHIDMLLMVEKDRRVHQYVKPNRKYMDRRYFSI